MKAVAGLIVPTDGEILLDGQPVADVSRDRGMVFQAYNLIPTLSGQENVEAALVPLGVGPAERRARAAKALESVGLGDRLRHLPSELSGGQQQRVAIARALVKEPKVLLADEPTGNLDEDTRDEIISLLEALWREHGLTLILVTHDSSLARRARSGQPALCCSR